MDNILAQGLMEELIGNGISGISKCLEILFNEAMKVERTRALGADPYERTEERQGHANGFKSKTLHLRSGRITLDIPQVRGMEFYPGSIEKGQRSEKALKLALAQMYISGVSTRRVTEITEVLCGFEVSSSQVSDAAKLLDEELLKFRTRRLEGGYKYIYLDAKYIKVRSDNQVGSQAVLIAIGVNNEGYREIIAIDVKSSEAKQNWKEFLVDLKERGISNPEMIISDDHAGLKQARIEVFTNVQWQRCQFHFAQNAQHKANSKPQKAEIGQDIRSIFQQDSKEDASRKAEEIAEKWKTKNSGFASWLEDNVHECFTVYQAPTQFHSKLRTSNGLERTIREVDRRTNIVGIFPNRESVLRLVTAVLIEVHEDWASATQPYMNFSN